VTRLKKISVKKYIYPRKKKEEEGKKIYERGDRKLSCLESGSGDLLEKKKYFFRG